MKPATHFHAADDGLSDANALCTASGLSLVFTIVDVWNVARKLWRALLVSLQTAPGFGAEAFILAVGRLPTVCFPSHTHSWSMAGERHVFSAQAVLAPDSDRKDEIRVKQQLRALLEPHPFERTTIETERGGEPCGAGAHAGEDAEAGLAPVRRASAHES